MDKEKERRPRPMGLNIGSSSIIMLFAVLCLTVLSALSLLSASSQLRLSERAANVVTKYYEADRRAAEIYERVVNGDDSALDELGDVTREQLDDGDRRVTFTVDVDDSQALSVTYTQTADGVFTLESWKLVEAGEWVPDDLLDLWGG